jgi:hypothetical protein
MTRREREKERKGKRKGKKEKEKDWRSASHYMFNVYVYINNIN